MEKWKLTKKGLIALSTKRPDLVASGLQASEDTLATIFKEYVNAIPNETLREPLGIEIDFSKIKSYLEKVDPTSILKKILEESRILLSQGVELDSISEEDLLDIIMVRSARQSSKDNQ